MRCISSGWSVEVSDCSDEALEFALCRMQFQKGISCQYIPKVITCDSSGSIFFGGN